MSSITVITRYCDICKSEIPKDKKFISASTYGVEFHFNCIVDKNFLEVFKLLSLDEIKIIKDENWGESEKIIYYDTVNLLRLSM